MQNTYNCYYTTIVTTITTIHTNSNNPFGRWSLAYIQFSLANGAFTCGNRYEYQRNTDCCWFDIANLFAANILRAHEYRTKHVYGWLYKNKTWLLNQINTNKPTIAYFWAIFPFLLSIVIEFYKSYKQQALCVWKFESEKEREKWIEIQSQKKN